MTKRQAQTLDFLKRYAAENLGASPSMREVADHLGLRSTSAAHRLLMALEAQGKIRKRAFSARGVEVIA